MCMKGRWSGGHSSWSGSDHTPCMKTPLSNSSAPSTASQCPSWNGEYWLFLSCTSVPPMARSLSFLLGTKTMCPWMCPRGGIWPKLPVESILLKSQGTVSNNEVIHHIYFVTSSPIKLRSLRCWQPCSLNDSSVRYFSSDFSADLPSVKNNFMPTYMKAT